MSNIEEGKRFGFGANWTRFLEVINDERIDISVQSIKDSLGVEDLKGKMFLDIGSGSGLSSLAARKLGAKVRSFDYDRQSVACTQELKRRYFKDDPDWQISEGSALDAEFLKSLGKFDIVYSWGVLHHTGSMWKALENAIIPLADKGELFIAIYNDQGGTSRRWRMIKKLYVSLPSFMRPLLAIACLPSLWDKNFLHDFIKLTPFKSWRDHKKLRGMSAWHDLVDWVGGYPFEVAKPEEIFDFYYKRGFYLTHLYTCAGGIGCNEFVMHR